MNSNSHSKFLYFCATDVTVMRCCKGGDREESVMKKPLFGLIAIAGLIMTIVTSAPASAQVWFDAGPVGVRVGPPPPWGWHRRHWAREYAYVAPACRWVHERIRTGGGRIIVRDREVCD
jgi:hypothetical protein